MQTHPQDFVQLVKYLEKFPVLNVTYSVKRDVYTYQSWDGLRLVFRTKSGNNLVMPTNSTLQSIEFKPDGFIRHVGVAVGVHLYTGDKPWRGESYPAWKRSQDEWDEIIAAVAAREDE